MESYNNLTATVDNQTYLIAGVVPTQKYPRYTLKTIQDMFEVVQPESLDDFLNDLRHAFEFYYQQPEEFTMDSIEWIDDYQNNMHVNLKFVDDGSDKQELVDLMNQHFVLINNT